MNRIKFSDEVNCAMANCCFPISGKKEMREKWTSGHDLFQDKEGRVYALVDSMNEVYFMDAVTGSLYQFGDCLSSVNLHIRGVKRSQAKSSEILLAMKAED